MRSALFIGSLVAAAILTAPASLAGNVDWPVNARVNGHEFNRVRVEGADCSLKLRLDFTAPEDGYSGRAKNRNVHRFRALLLFKTGKVLVTLPFNNRGPGKRVYDEVVDTSAQGCWGKDELQLKDVEVVGCRGKGCRIPEFQRTAP